MDHDDDLDTDGLTPLQAYRAVHRFAQLQGVLPLRLALHAALPQVLHADLLHLLRLNFVDDGNANPVAEADVLFAAFSNDLGHRYFRFDPHARAQLLAELDASYPDERQHRSQQVAEFLLQHFERERHSERSGTDAMYRSWVEVERWNALAYADPAAAAEQLAQVLQHATEPAQAAARLRVGTLAQSLAQPLVQHQRLLAYAAGVQALQDDDGERAQALLRRVGDDALTLGGVVLPTVAELLKTVGVRPATVELSDAPDPAQPQPEPAEEVITETAPEGHAEAESDAAEPPTEKAPLAPRQRDRAIPDRRPLPALQDCAYTAYISYAHADDMAWYGWVGSFRDELARGTGALLRGMRLPPLLLTAESGASLGAMSEELQARLSQSFALIVVVHDNYVDSTWSLVELELFYALYGEAGLRERLYVVALSLPAMQRLESHSVWRRLAEAGAQVWLPFYDEAQSDRPIDIYIGQGLVSPQFKRPFEQLRSDLVRKIKATTSTQPPPRPSSPPPPADRSEEALVFALGFGPARQASTVLGEFERRLRALPLEVRALTPKDAAAGFSTLKAATHLVLPFDNSNLPLRSGGDGGHLQAMRDAWQRQGHPASHVYWLDLRTPAERELPAGAARWVTSLGVETWVADDLLRSVARLLPPEKAAPPEHGACIYIESNRHERSLWETIGEQLQQRWDALLQALGVANAPLRCRGLPIDQLQAFPDLQDADGVLLLWGKKSSEALVAQVNLVEQKLAPGRDMAPGLVLYLMPPNPSSEPIPAWGWPVLRWVTSDEPAASSTAPSVAGPLDEETQALDHFLRQVLQHWQQRHHA